MRILHFISAPAAGGAEIYVKDLAKALVADGHEAHIGFLSSAKRVNRSESFEAEFLKELDEAGVKYFFAGDGSRKKPWQGVLKVRQYVKQNKIDVYHSHLFYGVIFGGFCKIPRIYTHHINAPNYSGKIWRLINLFVDEVVGISQICYDNIQCVLRKPARVIFNGVTPSKFDGLTKERTVNERCSFLSVGRITEQKNYELLVEAVGMMDPTVRAKCSFFVAGEGAPEHLARLQARCEALGINDSVTFMGNLNDIPNEMLNHQVFLMTSAYEGLPIALIEATISGLACLVTDAGGCKEVIEACENGVVIPRLDAAMVAQEIERFATEPDLVSQYSKASLKNAKKFFIDVASQKHIEMYKEKIKS